MISGAISRIVMSRLRTKRSFTSGAKYSANSHPTLPPPMITIFRPGNFLPAKISSAVTTSLNTLNGLIIFGLMDLGKAVIAGKEDEMKKAQGILIKRCIYAVMVFFVVTIVTLVFSLFGKSENSNLVNSNDTPKWSDCWNEG